MLPSTYHNAFIYKVALDVTIMKYECVFSICKLGNLNKNMYSSKTCNLIGFLRKHLILRTIIHNLFHPEKVTMKMHSQYINNIIPST